MAFQVSSSTTLITSRSVQNRGFEPGRRAWTPTAASGPEVYPGKRQIRILQDSLSDSMSQSKTIFSNSKFFFRSVHKRFKLHYKLHYFLCFLDVQFLLACKCFGVLVQAHFIKRLAYMGIVQGGGNNLNHPKNIIVFIQ